MQKLLDADVDGDGELVQAEFLAALATSREIAAKVLSDDHWAFDAHVEAWPLERREWCCLHAGISCNRTEGPLTAATPGASSFDAAGAATTTVANAPGRSEGESGEPYDCVAELDRWQSKWSMGKKDYCCRHHSHGCPMEAVVGRELMGGHATAAEWRWWKRRG